jgi:hypothetical protein
MQTHAHVCEHAHTKTQRDRSQGPEKYKIMENKHELKFQYSIFFFVLNFGE